MKAKNNSVSYFDMQFITSSISTTLVLLLLGLVVFFVLAAHNLSVYVKENISFSVLVSDDMKESDILKLQKRLDKEAFVKQTEYISKKQALREQTEARLSPPLIGQIAAEASLDADEDYLRDTYDEYVERRKCLIDGLNRIPGVYSPIPMGAFYTVAKLPVDDSDKFCAWCLSEFEYEGQTVFMAPASGFYTTPGSGRNEVRIAYVLKKDDLNRALFVLQKALEAYPGRTE